MVKFLRIAQWNANDLPSHSEKLQLFLHLNLIDIVLSAKRILPTETILSFQNTKSRLLYKPPGRHSSQTVSYTHLDVYKRQITHNQALPFSPYQFTPIRQSHKNCFNQCSKKFIHRILTIQPTNPPNFNSRQCHPCLLYTSRCV